MLSNYRLQDLQEPTPLNHTTSDLSIENLSTFDQRSIAIDCNELQPTSTELLTDTLRVYLPTETLNSDSE